MYEAFGVDLGNSFLDLYPSLAQAELGWDGRGPPSVLSEPMPWHIEQGLNLLLSTKASSSSQFIRTWVGRARAMHRA